MELINNKFIVVGFSIMSLVIVPTRRLSENREPTAEKPFWPDFPIIIVKERNYSPQMIEKSDSKGLSLATTSILGQPPRE